MTIIRSWDVETSGSVDEGGVVIESGWCDIDLKTRDVSEPKSQLFGLPIGRTLSPEVRAVHHIQESELPADLFDAEDTKRQWGFEGVATMVAHSAEYETSFMQPACPVICTYKVALRVWPDAPTHSNAGLRYWLQDDGRINPVDSLCLPHHRAGPDSYVTAHIMLALMDTGMSGKEMARISREPALLPRCPIGKFRNKPWPEVESGFMLWMLKQADMAENLKWNAKRELDRRDGLRTGLEDKAQAIDPSFGDPHAH